MKSKLGKSFSVKNSVLDRTMIRYGDIGFKTERSWVRFPVTAKRFFVDKFKLKILYKEQLSFTD